MTCGCEIYAMFVVIFRSPKSMKEYRWFLALFIWWDFWFDFFLGLTITPRMISPAPAVIVHGIAKLLVPYLGATTAKIALGCVVICSVSMVETEVLCLFYRLSVVQEDKRKHEVFMGWKSMTWFQLSGYAIALGITIPLVSIMANEDEILALLKEYPTVQIPPDSLIIYINVLNPKLKYIGLGILFAFTVAEFSCFLTSFFIFKTLRKNCKKFSSTTYRMHMKLTVLLIIQLIVPILTFILPIVIEVIFLLNKTVTSNFATMVGFVVLTFYPLSNCLLVLLYIRPYRQYTLNLLFGRCYKKVNFKNKHIVSIVGSQALTRNGT